MVHDGKRHARDLQVLVRVGDAVRALGQRHLREAEEVVGRARLLRQTRRLADEREQVGRHEAREHQLAVVAAHLLTARDEALGAAVCAHVVLLEEVDGVALLMVVEARDVLRAQLAVGGALVVRRRPRTWPPAWPRTKSSQTSCLGQSPGSLPAERHAPLVVIATHRPEHSMMRQSRTHNI